MIPKELQKVKQWTFSYSKKELKRPSYTQYASRGSLTYNQAVKNRKEGRYIGFYVTPKDPYILLDVDHIEHEKDLPKNLKNLVTVFNPTYCEFSPSGKGLRIIYKLDNKDAKATLRGNSFYAKEIFKDNKRNIQLNVGPPWMTITEDETSYSVSKIAAISLSVLDNIFKFNYVADDLGENDTPSLPSLLMVKNALFHIPLDQNPRVVRAIEQLTGGEYHHYDFWLKVLMSLHDYATQANKMVECFDLGLIWSKFDAESFKSDEDVKAKWDSFAAGKDASVTFSTIFKISRMCQIWWPHPGKTAKKDRERGLPIKPMQRSIENYKALFNFFDLKFHRDAGDPNLFYITCDKDIRDAYFLKGKQKLYFDKYVGPYSTRSFSNAALSFFMKFFVLGMPVQIIKEFTDHAFAICNREVNLFKLYYTTPFEDLPALYKVNEANVVISTFDTLWSCITLADNTSEAQQILCKSFYLKWLYNLLRNLVLPPTPYNNNIGILLMTGPEQVRKTTHFKTLLPTAFRHQIIFTSHGFKNESDLRDTAKISATCMIVVWDEIEQFLSLDTEANFKKTLDANAQTFIDKYETVASTIKPIAIYGATSNQSEFRLSGRTSRRILNIPIKWVDTSKMNALCWHPILHDIEDLMRDKDWLLTETELNLQATLHESIKAKTDLDFILREIFDFDTPFDHDYFTHKNPNILRENNRLMLLKEIANIVERKGGVFKRPALRQALMRACSFYTSTQHKSRVFEKFTVSLGSIKYGTTVLFVMPDINEVTEPFD